MERHRVRVYQNRKLRVMFGPKAGDRRLKKTAV